MKYKFEVFYRDADGIEGSFEVYEDNFEKAIQTIDKILAKNNWEYLGQSFEFNS